VEDAADRPVAAAFLLFPPTSAELEHRGRPGSRGRAVGLDDGQPLLLPDVEFAPVELAAGELEFAADLRGKANVSRLMQLLAEVGPPFYALPEGGLALEQYLEPGTYEWLVLVDGKAFLETFRIRSGERVEAVCRSY
jgi:hypothetical protein